MSYTYAQRKRPREITESAAERAAAPGPDLNALAAGTAKPSAAQTGRPIDLDAAIKAKMENAFGDLSAVKLYESPTVGAAGAEAMAQGSEIAFAPGMADFSTTEGQARLGHELSHVAARRSGAVSQSSGFLNDRTLEARADREGAIAAAGQQVYTGPVTGALSGASPSPAAAGPMQAKREKKQDQEITPARQIEPPESRSAYAAEFDLLNSQEGSDQERRKAYDSIAGPAADNMSAQQRADITSYIDVSQPINTYLRGQKDSAFYPQGEEEQKVSDQVQSISQAIRQNPLAEGLTTFRGVTDKFLAMLLRKNGLKKGLNRNGTVNHEWLNKNQATLRKKLVGSTFKDKGFTSTSTERGAAQGWVNMAARNEYIEQLEKEGKYDTINEMNVNPDTVKVPGAHLMRVNLPKGSHAAFVDRTSEAGVEGDNEQREVLLDKGSSFRISDLRKMEDSDSYELVLDLLAQEGKKKKKQ